VLEEYFDVLKVKISQEIQLFSCNCLNIGALYLFLIALQAQSF
jgi:hypothetical protein